MKKVEKKKTADQYLAERAIKDAERARAPQERDLLRIEVANLKAQLGQNNLSLQEKSATINDLQRNVLALKDRTIIGCDPGKRSLVYMMDNKGNKLQYTAPQRKRESKTKCNQRILLYERKKWNY